MGASLPLRVVFAGTPDFATVALASLCAATHHSHQVVGVLTQPDRPSGRGLKLQASSVKTFAQQQGIPCCQPRSLRLDGKFAEDAQAAQRFIAQLKPDVLVVAAYGLILPTWTLRSAPYGCLNIHASLLPRWRGAAPIHRAIEAGDTNSGVCIMQMDEGLDTGPILMSETCPVNPHETTATLHDKLADLGAKLLIESLNQLQHLGAVAQPEQGVCYAHKIEKAETWIDWHQSAQTIERKSRAFTPTPGLQTHFNGETIKIWTVQALSNEYNPSEIASAPGCVVGLGTEGIDIQTADGVIRILELQRAGGKRMSCAAFIQGAGSLKLGACLGSGAPDPQATAGS